MRVHHITPGHSDKDFGRSINELIEYLPDDDWICLRDIDTMPLHHRVFFKQCEEIAERGDFDLVSCMTNRLSVAYQLHDGKMSENFDVKYHLDIAKDRYEEFGSAVKKAEGNVAGVMMLFSKKTWEDVGGFREGGVMIQGGFVDHVFTESVKKIGGRVGIAQGIYMFHVYREWATKDIRLTYNHLNK